MKRTLNISYIINKSPDFIKTHHLILFIFSVIYLTIATCNHYFFRTYCYDYGVYNFAFYDYAHFRISECPLYMGRHLSFLQDHVSFTLMFISPLFWIVGWLTGTYTLLFIQIAIIIFGGWAVYKLIECKTENKLFASIALLMYFILLGRWTAFFSDCNLAIIASSLVPVLLLYIEKEITKLLL